MSDQAEPWASQVEAVFADIAQTRMVGVPVMNDALGVTMCGACERDGWRLGVLITPWFMNVLAFGPDDEAPARVGEKRHIALPSGAYEAIRGHEEALGFYWAISLFSPMFEFETMEVAIATADAAMAEIMTTPPAPAPEPKPALSRRALFRLNREYAA
ncbi:[NiFe]-hydrogenase assembly chaperone HybE [Novosphingobium sediminicola]|uniref:[NiFe] hydrogenase assembly HybE family chaperone n=1 Tax=Novosphingobium sediminicola TaxID=563162 RepID=A0A7W6G5E2_9SPHN|nr:[NiFe]-hydrogenase assembly chaperone HybE [Novosphingobium sediminicola]MBB3954594.1 [NiFe] hydrogenase assembly HybE family chaperone [Novosphingobium sediminicola]